MCVCDVCVMCVYTGIFVCIYVCVCMFVSGYERETETETKRQRNRDRERQRGLANSGMASEVISLLLFSIINYAFMQ